MPLFRGLDEAEEAELTARFAATRCLPKARAEARWKAAFEWLVASANFYRNWMTADELVA